MDNERLSYLANQLACHLEILGEEAAVEACRQHLVGFWPPQMKTAIQTGDRNGLDPIARAAVERLLS